VYNLIPSYDEPMSWFHWNGTTKKNIDVKYVFNHSRLNLVEYLDEELTSMSESCEVVGDRAANKQTSNVWSELEEKYDADAAAADAVEDNVSVASGSTTTTVGLQRQLTDIDERIRLEEELKAKLALDGTI
jgi:hypothetical protein